MFTEIHDFFEKIKEELETAGEKELKSVAADAKAAVEQAREDAMKAVSAASPDVQAAVKNALTIAEQALTAALASHNL